MNMFRITLILLSVIAMQLGCATSDASVVPLQPEIPQRDDPVDTVKKLWSAATESKTDIRDGLMSISTPAGFRQMECEKDRDTTKSKSGEFNVVLTPPQGWPYDLTMRTLEKAAAKKLTLDEAALERVRGDEGIVRIIYSDKPEHMFFEAFCFLTRDADGWKVFLITENPELDNPLFAADRCKPAPKLSSNIEAYTRRF